MKATSIRENIFSLPSISRRKVIKTLAMGTAGMLFSANPLLACTRRKKDKLGVALVGLGYYSTDLLAPALQQTKHCYLAGIVTGTPAKAEAWKAKYNIPDKNIYNYQTFDQIADNKDIDVIYVVLPNSMHHEFVIRAAKAGKHVITEKPIDIDPDAGQRLADGERHHPLRAARPAAPHPHRLTGTAARRSCGACASAGGRPPRAAGRGWRRRSAGAGRWRARRRRWPGRAA